MAVVARNHKNWLPGAIEKAVASGNVHPALICHCYGLAAGAALAHLSAAPAT